MQQGTNSTQAAVNFAKYVKIIHYLANKRVLTNDMQGTE